MYVPASVQCDVCATYHKEENGWLSVLYLNGDEGLTIRHFKEIYDKNPALCGEKCLHTYISQHLSEIQ